MRTGAARALLCVAVMCGPAPGHADESYGVPTQRRLWGEFGTNFEYYNKPAGLAWRNVLGDWADARGVPQGDVPLATLQLERNDQSRELRVDVTDAVRAWVAGTRPNLGFLLRSLGRGRAFFHSREAEAGLGPALLVTTEAGTVTVPAVADITVPPGIHGVRGDRDRLKVAEDRHTLVRFADIAPTTSVARAELRMTISRHRGPATVGVFYADPGRPVRPPPEVIGLALEHPRDRGLEGHPDVLLVADFEHDDWVSRWSSGGEKNKERLEVVRSDPGLRFEPIQGRALRVVIPEGQRAGLNLKYMLGKETGAEPEELYFRYYLRLAESWRPSVDGGKLPGLAGTYNRAGWGGRRADGFNGWSMRGSFGVEVPAPNPLAGLTPVGTYAYYGDMPGRYGSGWHWNEAAQGVLERNRWYSIEQHVRLNTPDMHDGLLEVWIDGRKAFEKRDILYRRTAELKIDRVWMNVYHGGTARAPTDLHLYIDNVVVARRYIGPLVR